MDVHVVDIYHYLNTVDVQRPDPTACFREPCSDHRDPLDDILSFTPPVETTEPERKLSSVTADSSDLPLQSGSCPDLLANMEKPSQREHHSLPERSELSRQRHEEPETQDSSEVVQA